MQGVLVEIERTMKLDPSTTARFEQTDLFARAIAVWSGSILYNATRLRSPPGAF